MKILMRKSEVSKALSDFKVELDKVLKEFSMFYRVHSMQVVPCIVHYPMGFAIEVDLYVANELVRHYDHADLLLMDLNDLMLKRLLKG